MDTKKNKSETFKKAAALKIKKLIDAWKPDVVITSDDNAAKYLIAHYYSQSKLPFVFCGVNWDASKYGFPMKNITGMIEVQMIDQLIQHISPYSKGKRIGSLRGDTLTNRHEANHFEQHLGVEIDTRFVNDITQWKKAFIQLHKDGVDMILLGEMASVKGYSSSKEEIKRFILQNTQVPTGHWDAWLKEDALITLATIPQEQGEYAAKVALDILGGKAVEDIPIVKNKKAKIFLNMKIAKKMDIIFPIELIERAYLIGAN